MENFENIKVGDKVIIHYRWSNDYVEDVTKVTKTTFTAGGAVFRKDSGWERGGDKWTPKSAHVATEEKIEEIRKENLKRKYVSYLSTKVKYEDLPLEKLQEIYDIIKK